MHTGIGRVRITQLKIVLRIPNAVATRASPTLLHAPDVLMFPLYLILQLMFKYFPLALFVV